MIGPRWRDAAEDLRQVARLYRAVDGDTEGLVIIKTPSIDLQGDAAYLERFMMEEWVARRQFRSQRARTIFSFGADAWDAAPP